VFAVLFLLFIVFLFYNSSWLGQRMYPIKYEQDIRISAAQLGVDPLLIAAIIRVESNYKPNLKSKKDAIGLMQIMPDTAAWIVQQAGFAHLTEADLVKEDVNIHIGAWYIRSLRQEFASVLDGSSKLDTIALIAAAYNAGPGNVSRWIGNGVWDGSYANASLIPYGETRHYIQRIVYYYKKYDELYAAKWVDEGQ